LRRLSQSVLLAFAGGIAGPVVAIAAARLLLAAGACFPKLAFSFDQHSAVSIALAFAFSVALQTGIVFEAAPAWFATRTDPAEMLRGSGRRMSAHSPIGPQGAPGRAGYAVGCAGCRCNHAGAKPQQARAPGFRVPNSGPRRGFTEPRPGHLQRTEVGGVLSRA
jgi:hypothetical protein